MAVTITSANVYINANVINTTDWDDCDDGKKQRILNVAVRELDTKYDGYTIPDNAVYEFSAVLATVYSDTNTAQTQGVKSTSVDGVSISFSSPAPLGPVDVTKYIPKTTADLINADPANADLPKVSAARSVKWTVM